MVKNTIGGKRGKMMANKRVGGGGRDKNMRLSMNDDEIYVCVSKVFGSGMFELIDNQNVIYRGQLRGKMKGPNKRHNFVTLFSILLVGKRSDLSDSNICDILFVYDDHDVLSLSLLPNLNIDNILSFHRNHFFSNSNSNSNSTSDLLFHFSHQNSDINHNNLNDLDLNLNDSDSNLKDSDINFYDI